MIGSSAPSASTPNTSSPADPTTKSTWVVLWLRLTAWSGAGTEKEVPDVVRAVGRNRGIESCSSVTEYDEQR
jgi:hypothetical protein